MGAVPRMFCQLADGFDIIGLGQVVNTFVKIHIVLQNTMPKCSLSLVLYAKLENEPINLIVFIVK